MHKLGRLIIGGIESKIFNLVVINLIIVVVAYTVVIYHASDDLTALVNNANEKQEESMKNITNDVMGSVVNNTMGQSTVMEAYIAEDLFKNLECQVQMIGDYAQRLLDAPEKYPKVYVRVPDKKDDGKVKAQLIYGKDVSLDAPEVSLKIKLLGNLSEMMCSLYSTFSVNSCFVSVPEGFTIMVDDRTASKFDENGERIYIDGTTRSWYKNADKAGGMYLSDIEIDAFTGKKGMVCALPIYVNGKLEAVVGADLFLDSIESGIDSVSKNGLTTFIVNNDGHVIFSSDKDGFFKVNISSQAENLRENENKELASFINDALAGNTDVRVVDIDGKKYYMSGSAMPAVGWALISVYDKELTEQPSNMLVENNNKILDEAKTQYEDNIAKSKKTIIIVYFKIKI